MSLENFSTDPHPVGARVVLRALGEMGPAAGAALTILEPMSIDEIARRRKLVEESLWEEPGPCPDEFDFPVGWTIYRIRGGG